MPMREIEELKEQFINQLTPLRIYLFGSFANEIYTEDSDFDFYIVVDEKQWIDMAEMDYGVAKHLFETYYPKP